MAGFFKKLAGAFVEMPEAKPEAKPSDDVSELEALLTSTAPVEEAAPTRSPEPAKPARTAMDWTLSEVYAAGKVQSGRNSAPQVIKLMEGLAMLPTEHRLVAIRAMDQADDDWDEATVIADAQRRIAVLDHFVGVVKKDEIARTEAARAASQAVRASNDARLADLDQQIAALQAQRQQVVQNTANSEAQSQEQALSVQAHADVVRARIQAEKEKFQALVAFFQSTT